MRRACCRPGRKGQALAQTLKRVLEEKVRPDLCQLVNWADACACGEGEACKDANDILLKHGGETLAPQLWKLLCGGRGTSLEDRLTVRTNSKKGALTIGTNSPNNSERYTSAIGER